MEIKKKKEAVSFATLSGPDKAVGNFVLGEWFGEAKCRYGHRIRLFNIGRDHFVACDRCRTFIHVGSNLMSRWRQETKDIWQANHDGIKDYVLIE